MAALYGPQEYRPFFVPRDGSDALVMPMYGENWTQLC